MEDLVNGRSILVTGATGLLGSHLVPALLARGARVVTFVRDLDPQSELVRSGTIDRTAVAMGRLEDLGDVERALAVHEVEGVFHLGAQTLVGAALRDPIGTLESNVRGTWNLLEACRRQRIGRVVVASSDKAYGDAEVLPYDEDTPLRGRGPYDVSKSCTDLLAQSWAITYGLPVIIARCGNLYGGGDLNWSRLIPGTIRSLLRGERPILRSDGRFKRDWVYVGDAVSAYLRLYEVAAERSGEAFNFGPGAPADVLEVVAAVSRAVGVALEPDIRNEARAEIRDQWLDSRRAESELGWTPSYTLDTGLVPTVAWYRGVLGG